MTDPKTQLIGAVGQWRISRYHDGRIEVAHGSGSVTYWYMSTDFAEELGRLLIEATKDETTEDEAPHD